MRTFLSSLLFFPSITFGLLTAEIFPWAILYALVYVRRYSIPLLLVMSILIASGVSVGFSNGFHTNTNSDVIRSLGAYINALMGLQIVIAASAKESARLLRVLFAVLLASVCMGLLQSSALLDVDWLIQALIPRGQTDALLDSGRGATLFAAEPARAGVELVLMYATCRLTFLGRRNSIALDLFFLAFQVLIIKSASAVALSVLFLGIIYANLKYVWVVITLSCAAGLFIALNPDSRVALLVHGIFEIEGLSEALFYLANESGNRILSIYTFMYSGLSQPFGAGVGAWPESSIQAIIASGVDWTQFRYFTVVSDGELSPFRGSGLIPNLMLDIGVVGTIVLLIGIYFAISNRVYWCREAKQVSILIFFKMLMFGSPGDPIPFLALALVFSYHSSLHQTMVLRKYGKEAAKIHIK